MSIDVRDLRPGERVVLNCPKAKGAQKREAQFEGIFERYADAMNDPWSSERSLLIQRHTVAFSRTQGPWSRFLLQTSERGSDVVMRTPGGDALHPPGSADAETRLMAVFAVEPDGGLREEEGRRIFIERRVQVNYG